MDILKSIFGIFVIKDAPPVVEKNFLCPACNNEIHSQEKYFVKIYLCPDCSGFFITQNDMNSLLKNEFSDEKDDLFQSLPAKGHTFNRSSELRNCPVCSIKMDNTQFQYSSGIWIDSCPEGHGIWIDGGEMQLLKEYIFSSKDFEEKVDFRINRMKWFYGEVYNSLYINLPDKKRKHYYSLVLDEWCMLQGIDRYERVQIRDVGYVNRKKTCVTPLPPGDFTMEREISYAVKDGLLDEEKVAKIKNKYFSFETWKASGCNRG